MNTTNVIKTSIGGVLAIAFITFTATVGKNLWQNRKKIFSFKEEIGESEEIKEEKKKETS